MRSNDAFLPFDKEHSRDVLAEAGFVAEEIEEAIAGGFSR